VAAGGRRPLTAAVPSFKFQVASPKSQVGCLTSNACTELRPEGRPPALKGRRRRPCWAPVGARTAKRCRSAHNGSQERATRGPGALRERGGCTTEPRRSAETEPRIPRRPTEPQRPQRSQRQRVLVHWMPRLHRGSCFVCGTFVLRFGPLFLKKLFLREHPVRPLA
jgi:hypothetical protein